MRPLPTSCLCLSSCLRVFVVRGKSLETSVRLNQKVAQQLMPLLGRVHDVHERVPPVLAIQLAKDLEPYRLFFLEDPFSPEDVGYYKHLRAQTSTPLAMGELFSLHCTSLAPATLRRVMVVE